MSTKNNPFAAFDPFKAWADFTPAKATEQFTKMLADMKFPQANVDAIVASQRKSFEALGAANQVAMEGLRSVAQRQSEILSEAVEKTTAVMDAASKSKNPQDIFTAQADVAQKAYEKAVKDLNELSTMLAKTSSDAATPINARIQASFVELKDMAASAAK